jgi:hypothetical protein
VGVATVPARPFPEVTETEVTVPEPPPPPLLVVIEAKPRVALIDTAAVPVIVAVASTHSQAPPGTAATQTPLPVVVVAVVVELDGIMLRATQFTPSMALKKLRVPVQVPVTCTAPDVLPAALSLTNDPTLLHVPLSTTVIEVATWSGYGGFWAWSRSPHTRVRASAAATAHDRKSRIGVLSTVPE